MLLAVGLYVILCYVVFYFITRFMVKYENTSGLRQVYRWLWFFSPIFWFFTLVFLVFLIAELGLFSKVFWPFNYILIKIFPRSDKYEG